MGLKSAAKVGLPMMVPQRVFKTPMSGWITFCQSHVKVQTTASIAGVKKLHGFACGVYSVSEKAHRFGKS